MPFQEFFKDVKAAVDLTVKEAAEEIKHLSYSVQYYHSVVADTLSSFRQSDANTIDYFPFEEEEKPEAVKTDNTPPSPTRQAQTVAQECLILKLDSPERIQALQQQVEAFEKASGLNQWQGTTELILPKEKDDPAEKLAAMIASKAARDIETTKAFFSKVFSR